MPPGGLFAVHRGIDIDASFVYNESGLRVQKTVNEVVTKYTLHGKNIVHMTQGSDELHFFYDAQNKPAVVVYNGTTYSYVKNLQGDIVAILDSNKNIVVSYGYDAWGRPIKKEGSLAATLGTVQPFRYRGYVYDEETGLYYLRSRYFMSEACRFVNADKHMGNQCVLAHNLFVYCINIPTMLTDPAGKEGTPFCLADVPNDKLSYYESLTTEDKGYGYTAVTRKTSLFIPYDQLETVITDIVLNTPELDEYVAYALTTTTEYVVPSFGVNPRFKPKAEVITDAAEMIGIMFAPFEVLGGFKTEYDKARTQKARTAANEKKTGIVYTLIQVYVAGGRGSIPVQYDYIEEWTEYFE